MAKDRLTLLQTELKEANSKRIKFHHDAEKFENSSKKELERADNLQREINKIRSRNEFPFVGGPLDNTRLLINPDVLWMSYSLSSNTMPGNSVYAVYKRVINEDDDINQFEFEHLVVQPIEPEKLSAEEEENVGDSH